VTDRPAVGIPDRTAALELLARGSLELAGRLTDASNATFLCRVRLDGLEARCVYKPRRGERPLDDFPDGTLAQRERAAFLLSEAFGWYLVPPTVLRDGPLGPGMVQLWMEADPAADVVEMILAPDPRLRRVAVFDVVANNADRKGGHLLPTPEGHIYAVDHGVCFSPVPKLRTVLWGWRGEPLDDDEVAGVERVVAALAGQLAVRLGELLSPAEVGATERRARGLLHTRCFPRPDPGRPALPWPPF
jgi:hypothetical protein